MNLFDIVGPVMVGPSSSHTAGAVRIGYVTRKLMGGPIKKAEILLYGSFLETGKGHGTNLAIVAGLLGMLPDDERIPYSYEIAKEAGMEFSFGRADLKESHPNAVQIRLLGMNGKEMEVVGESIGGSRINIASIDGLRANFSGDTPTLIVRNDDKPGYVAEVTKALAARDVNIATMHLYRAARGTSAVMVIECDREVPEASIESLRALSGIRQVTYYSPN
jgi:L-serine dehydratase